MSAVTKGQRNLLLFILGIAIIFLPIKLIAMGNFDEKKTIDAEKSERQTYYNDLKAKDANRQQYIDDTEKYKADYEDIISKFPSEIYQDNTIMYLQGIKDEYKFNFPTVAMGEEVLFYTLGAGGAVGDVSLDAPEATTEAAAEGTDAEGTAEPGAEGTTAGVGGDIYNCYSATFPTTYQGKYEDIKKVIDYIVEGDMRMTLDSISIAFNEEKGFYEGDLSFTSYAVNGGERTTDHADVKVQTGVNNIFGNPTARPSNTTGNAATE